jgi:hypothetical protein
MGAVRIRCVGRLTGVAGCNAGMVSAAVGQSTAMRFFSRTRFVGLALGALIFLILLLLEVI